MQLNLFDDSPLDISIDDGELTLFPQNFSNSHILFKSLKEKVLWRQDKIFIKNKAIEIPRLNSWYGDAHKEYSYSNIHFEAEPWFDELLFIKTKVEAVCQQNFNSALINLYRDGNDSVDWHADDEVELGLNPVIASVSLGQTRRFLLKHRYKNYVPRVTLDLEDSSILLMKGTLQHNWLHKLPKTQKNCGERINITFRNIKS